MRNVRARIVIATMVALATSTELYALQFTGSSSGKFVDPVGPSGMVTSGVGTSLFTWGDGTAFYSPPSSLGFSGTPFSTEDETYFTVGSIDYFNGTIAGGTQADQVNLAITLQFTTPLGNTEDFTYVLQLLNTYNTGTPEDNADIVYLPSLFSSDLFTYGGEDYTLELGFGEVSSGGFSELDRLFAFEGATAQGVLIGRITSEIPGVPDGGSTALLMAVGVLALGASRRLIK